MMEDVLVRVTSLIWVLCIIMTDSLALINPAPVSASFADDMTVFINTNVVFQITIFENSACSTYLPFL